MMHLSIQLRIDYGDYCVIGSRYTKIVISQLWIIKSKHAIHHYNAKKVPYMFIYVI